MFSKRPKTGNSIVLKYLIYVVQDKYQDKLLEYSRLCFLDVIGLVETGKWHYCMEPITWYECLLYGIYCMVLCM